MFIRLLSPAHFLLALALILSQFPISLAATPPTKTTLVQARPRPAAAAPKPKPAVQVQPEPVLKDFSFRGESNWGACRSGD